MIFSLSVRKGLVPILSLCLSGCSSGDRSNFEEKCFIFSENKKSFIGRNDCLSHFPIEKIEGYWVVDFETSIFFAKEQDFNGVLTKNAYSLSFPEEKSKLVSDIRSSREARAFYVRFYGRKSELPGLYGKIPELKGGILVVKSFNIEREIKIPTLITYSRH